LSPAELPELSVPDAGAWRAWLLENHRTSTGVWLLLAKKGTETPTSLRYQEALEEALCHGWIDGQARAGDEQSYSQRFTPRRQRSAWSRRNTEIAERLQEEGRMQPAGLEEIERAMGDGRWEAAYAGSATIEVPPELEAALRANPAAGRFFEQLSSQNRYAILYRIATARRPETKARRIDQFVAMLARGETIHPQKPPRAAG
jgi:uncharacterized protein YdeI (YjbR/CyaY-like superfamily)